MTAPILALLCKLLLQPLRDPQIEPLKASLGQCRSTADAITLAIELPRNNRCARLALPPFRRAVPFRQSRRGGLAGLVCSMPANRRQGRCPGLSRRAMKSAPSSATGGPRKMRDQIICLKSGYDIQQL